MTVKDHFDHRPLLSDVEAGGQLRSVSDSGFQDRGIRKIAAFRTGARGAIAIPETVFALKRGNFAECSSFEDLTCEGAFRLDRILQSVFMGSSRVRMTIHPNVSVIDGSSLIGIHQNAVSISCQNTLFRIVENGFLKSRDESVIFRSLGSCTSVVISRCGVVLRP
jgi:hypothetical protein